MEKENKYYTPTIEEFHIGFEYESLQDERSPEINESWDKNCIETVQEFKEFLNYYENDHIAALRVKYLDREDIESCDFKIDLLASGPNDDIFNLEKYVEGKGTVGITLIFKTFVVIYIFAENREQVIFTGNLNNKSEFKKLMHQLEI